jgi:hypothetical protein
VNSIGNHYLLPTKTKILGKLLWRGFVTFLKFFLKFKEQSSFKKAVVNNLIKEKKNALIMKKHKNYFFKYYKIKNIYYFIIKNHIQKNF